MKKGLSSTLSPHAQPFYCSSSSTSLPSSSSTSSCSSVFLPNLTTVKAAPIAIPSPKVSSGSGSGSGSGPGSDDDDSNTDDGSLIDSPCYKGRNHMNHYWSSSPISITAPLPLLHHMGQTSPPPRVTVNTLAEEKEHSISASASASAAATAIASLMLSHEKDNGFSSSPHHNPPNQILHPGLKREGILQTIVDLSNMLLQIPLNAADLSLSESDYEMVNVIIKDLKKLQEEYKKGYIRKLAKAYRSDEEKGKTNTCSALCSQPQPQNWYVDDNVDNIEATVYKDLWMSAKTEKHEMEYKLQHARMAVHTQTNN